MSWRRPSWSVVAVVALVTVLAGGFAYLGTWPPYVQVLSDSMEPEIAVGDIVLLKDMDRAPEVGDIVVVRVPEVFHDRLPPIVIHRVIEVDEAEGVLRTQGDAIDTPDPFEIPIGGVDTRVLTVLPGAAQILAFLRSPLGLLWVVAGVFLLIVMPVLDAQRQRVELGAASLQATDQLAAQLRMLREDTEAALGIHRDEEPPPPPVDVVDERPPPTRPFRPPRQSSQQLRAVTIDVPARSTPAPDDATAEQTRALIAEVQEHLSHVADESDEVKSTVRELVGAVGEYGEHLRSHTAILQSMSAASGDLAAVVASLKETLDTGRAGVEPPAAIDEPDAAPGASAEAPSDARSASAEALPDPDYLDALLAAFASTPPRPASAEADADYLDGLLDAFASAPPRPSPAPPTAAPTPTGPAFLQELLGAAPAPQAASAEARPEPPILLANLVLERFGREAEGWGFVRLADMATAFDVTEDEILAAFAWLSVRGTLDVVGVVPGELYLCQRPGA